MRFLAGLMIALAVGTAEAAPAENHWGDASGSPIAREYGRALSLIDAAMFADALPILRSLADQQPGNADVWNMLGYAYRKSGDLNRAGEAYRKALLLAPYHLGALEYQGELYLMLGDVEAAKANLKRLRAICGGECEEAEELAEAIAAR